MARKPKTSAPATNGTPFATADGHVPGGADAWGKPGTDYSTRATSPAKPTGRGPTDFATSPRGASGTPPTVPGRDFNRESGPRMTPPPAPEPGPPDLHGLARVAREEAAHGGLTPDARPGGASIRMGADPGPQPARLPFKGMR